MPEADRVYRVDPDVVYRQVAGESLLVPIRGRLADMQRIFALDGTAEFIWQQLDGTRNVASIVAGVVEAFDVTAEQARKDAEAFIVRLHDEGLIAEVA